jgi:hypothetical protein
MPDPHGNEEAPPAEEDLRWWASQNVTWDDDEVVPDAEWDRQAEEAEAQDLYDRGVVYC